VRFDLRCGLSRVLLFWQSRYRRWWLGWQSVGSRKPRFQFRGCARLLFEPCQRQSCA
jgi:hypothetical protein